MHALNCYSKIYILMYINVFLNMKNQKIVYRDLGTAKIKKNTSTTKKVKHIY